ncbi:DUF4258 domain-containing protein [Deinococcus maricopensis]|uniref:DUF4258 domain-containing protein n=1 Tax=Deinococcus maricopensis (strain DSM 21211 / LMG 22137 / NRRL B-23946 / LB-34) TaxID=709986 RepID=E8U5X1_DEIML|nr:DUF4258 domain-containing protein [Deinococcus maricopensis]ADV66460.1 hypothetical protein Deima_0805 [Deinococcus maricopensis DSM 21211]
MQHNDLLTLRAQLAKAEKEARRTPKTPPPPPAAKPVKPQREADLAGIDTRDHTLARAHARLRDAILDGHYDVRPHAVGHARAEGFLEHDILHVLMSGRVKAVYPEDRRWLVCGTFEAHGFRIPLHVVVEVHERDHWMDIVTAFVPKNPHHVISRARLAVLLRWDNEQVQHRTATPGNKPGNRSKGHWRKGA